VRYGVGRPWLWGLMSCGMWGFVIRVSWCWRHPV
jgi:hypothetical protein